MTPAPAVLDQFPAARGLAWREVVGGFSGAAVWRGDDHAGPRVALKQWPPGTAATRVRWVHSRVRAARPLSYVPVVCPADDGDSVVEHGGRCFELLTWAPGQPVAAPTAAACRALAELHARWGPPTEWLPPPAVARRRRLFGEVGPHLLTTPTDPLLARAVVFVRRGVPAAVAALAPFDVPGPVQPCLCDPRPEHFLFVGDQLTGVIDFAAMKPDHPAVDLARLLGETGFLDEGVAAYRAAGGCRAVTPELVRVLADTGRVGAVANWLLRLADRPPTAAEADRLERLLTPLVH